MLQLKDRLESCEGLLDKNIVANDLPRAKQALAHHEDSVKDIENAAMTTFCRGEELIDYLKQSEIELRVRDPLTTENIDAQTHVHNLLEVLHRKRRDLRDSAEERKIKLEQNLLLRQLESDAKQVSTTTSSPCSLLSYLIRLQCLPASIRTPTESRNAIPCQVTRDRFFSHDSIHKDYMNNIPPLFT